MTRLLLDWYGSCARTLPWRSFPTPYRVWISEIMLQQTRVEAVLPYFERFIDALPDVAALAVADDAVLMKLWQGLGYYGRVRNLKQAARVIVERHGGELPGTVEDLRALPGVGDYTAGAIASIAFGQPAEAVDGNVLRVLSRLAASRADVSLPQTKRRLRELAASLLPEDRPGDFNQALMDLGATVCLPGGEPRCAVCPLAELCEGLKQGVAGSLPVKAVKKPRRVQQRTVFVLVSAGRVLLRKRPQQGLLAGLWELPGAEGCLGSEQATALLSDWGAAPQQDLIELGQAKHVFTHVEWRMRGWRADTAPFTPPWEHAWADTDALRRRYAVPSAFQPYMRSVIQ